VSLPLRRGVAGLAALSARCFVAQCADSAGRVPGHDNASGDPLAAAGSALPAPATPSRPSALGIGAAVRAPRVPATARSVRPNA